MYPLLFQRLEKERISWFAESTHSENTLESKNKADPEATNDKSSTVDITKKVSDNPKASSLTSLKAILNDISSYRRNGPGKLFERC